jgi:hypothetical protein
MKTEQQIRDQLNELVEAENNPPADTAGIDPAAMAALLEIAQGMLRWVLSDDPEKLSLKELSPS